MFGFPAAPRFIEIRFTHFVHNKKNKCGKEEWTRLGSRTKAETSRFFSFKVLFIKRIKDLYSYRLSSSFTCFECSGTERDANQRFLCVLMSPKVSSCCYLLVTKE